MRYSLRVKSGVNMRKDLYGYFIFSLRLRFRFKFCFRFRFRLTIHSIFYLFCLFKSLGREFYGPLFTLSCSRWQAGNTAPRWRFGMAWEGTIISKCCVISLILHTPSKTRDIYNMNKCSPSWSPFDSSAWVPTRGLQGRYSQNTPLRKIFRKYLSPLSG